MTHYKKSSLIKLISSITNDSHTQCDSAMAYTHTHTAIFKQSKGTNTSHSPAVPRNERIGLATPHLVVTTWQRRTTEGPNKGTRRRPSLPLLPVSPTEPTDMASTLHPSERSSLSLSSALTFPYRRLKLVCLPAQCKTGKKYPGWLMTGNSSLSLKCNVNCGLQRTFFLVIKVSFSLFCIINEALIVSETGDLFITPCKEMMII